MSDVFISYARESEGEAHRIAEGLRALGYRVWRDDEIPAHRAFGEMIEERLAAARVVLVLWSAPAAKSEWVRSEASRARAMGKLVQLTLDKSPLPMPFDQIQCANLVDWMGETDAPGWRKIVDSIGELAIGEAPASRGGTTPDPPLPNKPSIALMPFTNLSGDPEQDYFADGMVEEIARALSRVKSLFVIGGGSSLSFKAKTTTPREVARILGVRYVLEGSVRKSGGRVRIAVKLIDGTDGAQIWADRFEDTLEDVFALQDRVALGVAGVIEPAVRAANMRRVASRPTGDLGSYDLYLRAFSVYRTLARADLVGAVALLDRAIALDPENALALALGAFCRVFLVTSSWSDDPRGQLAQARELVSRALKVGADDPEVLTNLTFATGLGRDLETAVALAKRAVELNPGSPYAWSASGFAKTNIGEPGLGFEHLETALRLDPLSPLRPVLLALQGSARCAEGRFGEAVALLKQAVQLLPDFLMAHVFLAASLGHLGDRAAGREVIARFRTLTPVGMRAFAAGQPEPGVRKLVLEGIELVEADDA
jgi:TolB-like protein/Flp pilus assembly protein TadD